MNSQEVEAIISSGLEKLHEEIECRRGVYAASLINEFCSDYLEANHTDLKGTKLSNSSLFLYAVEMDLASDYIEKVLGFKEPSIETLMSFHAKLF